MKVPKICFTPGNADDVNFYFEGDGLAVSDNHRMAYWFFRNNTAEGSTLIQVDAHLDCSYFREPSLAHLREVEPFGSAQQFAEDRYHSDNGETPAVRYGNWIPALLAVHPLLFKRVLLCCHRPAGPLVLKDLPGVEEIDEADVFSSDLLNQTHTCLSIDIDYYFTEKDGTFTLRQTNPTPVKHFRRLLDTSLLLRHVPLFVALSPQCCGGWQNVIPFVQCMDEVLDLDLAQVIKECLKQSHLTGQRTAR